MSGNGNPLATRSTAARIAAAVRGGEVSAVDVFDAFADRIRARNDDLNALVALRLDGARADVLDLDRRIRAGESVGPLAGVPFTVKDVVATADLPTTCGSRLLEGHRTAMDATVVARLRDADAILMGKTNSPEFAFGLHTVNDLFGLTRNPLGDFTPGGSSGGEAAAIAAGLSALGVATDFGGSVRWPAQCTGIVGLRPTVGRCPATGILPAVSDDEPAVPNARSFQGRVQVAGLLAGSIADLAIGLGVVAGPDGFDPQAVPVPVPDSGDVRMADIEVRHGADVGGQHVDSEVADAAAWAVEVLRRNGARATAGLPRQLDDAVDLYTALRKTDQLTEIARISGGREEALTAFIRGILAAVPSPSESDVIALWAARDRLAGELAGWLHGNRLLVLPVASTLPWRIADEPGFDLLTRFDDLACCRAISLFGLPVLSAPCPPAADGRPVSIQIVAPPFREDLVLAAGTCLEIERQKIG